MATTTILEWPAGEWSQYAYMARIGPDGKLISYDNVRTREQFAKIKVNQFNKNDVLRTIGHPTETEYLPLKKQEVWSYRYKEEGMWNSMMHVYFDGSGIVRGMENGQDPLYLRDGFWGPGVGIGIGSRRPYRGWNRRRHRILTRVFNPIKKDAKFASFFLISKLLR